MRILVTGSAGHLGEALMRILPEHGHEAVGLDLLATPFTSHVGSIGDRRLVREAIEGCDAVIHTATLHKPHVATHAKQDFVATNISGTLCVLEEAVAAGVTRVVFTSTTSAFGAALSPAADAPAAWVDESATSVPKNIYGVTKTAAEGLCQLFARRHGLGVIALRTSRFFPEEDDRAEIRDGFGEANAKANEYLYRRVDLEDAALAHIAALPCAAAGAFEMFVISATTPFGAADLAGLRRDPAAIVAAHFPQFEPIYGRLGYRMFADLERVYVNARARQALGWRPRHDFGTVLAQLDKGEPIGSALARRVGSKGYHAQTFAEGPYPVE